MPDIPNIYEVVLALTLCASGAEKSCTVCPYAGADKGNGCQTLLSDAAHLLSLYKNVGLGAKK